MSISAYIGEQEWHMLRSKIVESWSDYFYSSNSWKECYTWHRRHARDALTATTCCSVAHGTELQEGRWFRNDKAWWTTSSGLWGEPWRLDEGISRDRRSWHSSEPICMQHASSNMDMQELTMCFFYVSTRMAKRPTQPCLMVRNGRISCALLRTKWSEMVKCILTHSPTLTPTSNSIGPAMLCVKQATKKILSLHKYRPTPKPITQSNKQLKHRRPKPETQLHDTDQNKPTIKSSNTQTSTNCVECTCQCAMAHSAMPDCQKWSELLRIAQDEVVRNGQMYSDS